MNKVKVLPNIFFVLCFLFAGCSVSTAPVATGAVTGTVVGAAGGALVGAAIANGDIATSALLGAGIGLPIGLIVGYAWKRQNEEAAEAARIEQYIRNQESIKQKEREIEALREEVLMDSQKGIPDFEQHESQFMGARMGSPL